MNNQNSVRQVPTQQFLVHRTLPNQDQELKKIHQAMAKEPTLILISPEKPVPGFLKRFLQCKCTLKSYFKNLSLTSTLHENVKQIIDMVIVGTILLWE